MLNPSLQAPNRLNLETEKVGKLARAQEAVWEGPVGQVRGWLPCYLCCSFLESQASSPFTVGLLVPSACLGKGPALRDTDVGSLTHPSYEKGCPPELSWLYPIALMKHGLTQTSAFRSGFNVILPELSDAPSFTNLPKSKFRFALN